LITLWTSFLPVHAQTPTNLAYFIEAAHTSSPLLSDYNNQLISSRIDSLKLRAAYGFIVSGEGAATYAPVVRGWGYDKDLTNGKSVFAGVRVSRELVGRNNLQARLDSYRAGMAQVVAQKELTIETLDKQITDQYIATYTSQQQYLLSKELVAFLNQEDKVLKQLTQQATFKQTDYLSFKVTLQQNQLVLQQQTADWQNNYLLLNYLSGRVDTTIRELDAPDIGGAQQPSAFETSVYARAFRADSVKLANDAEVIAYDYKPKISAFSDAGYQSSFIQTPYRNWGLSVGVAVSLPLYDGHQKNLLLQQNQLAEQTRRSYASRLQNQYQQQVFQLQNQLEQYRRMMDTANEQLVYTRTLVDANAKQLPTGDVKMVDFILSINNVLNLQASIIQYNYALLSLQNQLTHLILQ